MHNSVYTMTLFLQGLSEEQISILNNQTNLANTVLNTLHNMTGVPRFRFAVEVLLQLHSLQWQIKNLSFSHIRNFINLKI